MDEFNSFNENVIEFLNNSKIATLTLSQGRFVTKIKKLAEDYPQEVQIVHENADGSIVAHMPVKYICISKRTRTMTEEQRQQARERLQALHIKKKGK